MTEWNKAINNDGRYFFVIAKCNDDKLLDYQIISPEELLKFSSIPPFKINFNYPLESKGKKIESKISVDNLKSLTQFFTFDLGLKLKED